MRLILVRHGDPDYANDCLTGLGHKQAEAAAQRLVPEGITRIYSSPMGRARQTAGYTARLLGLPIEVLDFMHEIGWGSDNDDPVLRQGHPWSLADHMIAEEDFSFAGDNWKEHPAFKANRCNDYLRLISESSDELLNSLGFAREGNRYRCTKENEETIALFAHGGSGACLLSRLLNLPFPYVCSVLAYGLTSVTILSFESRPGELVFPRVELFGDMSHVRNLMSAPAPCGN